MEQIEEKKDINLSQNIEPKSKIEEGVEEVAQDLKLNLPETNQPWPIKIIALFTMVGGLSIIGSTFADIFNPSEVNFWPYVLRLFTGLIFLLISYGIIKQKSWSIWLYGFLVFLGIFLSTSFIVLLLPILIIIYFYTQRRYFRESVFDIITRNFFQGIVNFYNKLIKKEIN